MTVNKTKGLTPLFNLEGDGSKPVTLEKVQLMTREKCTGVKQLGKERKTVMFYEVRIEPKRVGTGS